MIAILLLAGLPVAPPLVDARELKAHIRFLADDLLEGRGTATRGYALAAAYVASRLEAAGVEPGTADGYFQRVPLLRAERVGADLDVPPSARRLEAGKDFLASYDFTRTQAEVEAPLVFVGYGVRAPEQGHDDYAGLEVRGKLVLRLSGAPPTFEASLRAHHSSVRVKNAAAVAAGARGVLEVKTRADEERYPFARMAAHAAEPGYRWVDRDGRPADTFPELEVGAALSQEAAAVVLAGSGRSLDALLAAAAEGKPVERFPLARQVRLRVQTRHSRAESPNVVGRLPGSDPALAAEHVVLSAHLDHLGIGHAEDGDAIHNGAYDNGTGIATLLEIARALARGERPKRTVVFAAVTGEEHGLVGSDYFAEHPPVAGPLVANVNVDMLLALFPAADVIALGSDHSTLGPLAERAAAAVGLALVPDPMPAEVRFIRSDQYSFIRRGIPALKISAGSRSARPGEDGGALITAWLRGIYHSPRDEAAQPMDWPTLARLADMNLLIVRDAANAPDRPAWKPGDFFGRTYGEGR